MDESDIGGESASHDEGSKCSESLLGRSARNAVYVRNRSPTAALKDMTPFEAWWGSKPSVKHLRIFGCCVYALLPKRKHRKLDAKTQKCLFLGYTTCSKAYRLWCSALQTVLVHRNVTFDETHLGREGGNEEKRPQSVSEASVEVEEHESEDGVEVEDDDIFADAMDALENAEESSESEDEEEGESENEPEVEPEPEPEI